MIRYQSRPISSKGFTLRLSSDVFTKLDDTILRNMDVKYYQRLFDYCQESEANNFLVVGPEYHPCALPDNNQVGRFVLYLES